MQAPARPNILLITSDQHRGDCFGFEGRATKTPHIDGLAKAGSRFSACITPNVVCMPARASILTGLLPLTHGVIDNGYDLRQDLGAGGFAGRLGKAGYHTGFIGKAHFSSLFTFSPTGTPEDQQSRKLYGADWFGPYMGFEHVELINGGHYRRPPAPPPIGQHYERWYYADGRGEEKNILHLTQLRPDGLDIPQTWFSALPAAWRTSEWIGNRTISFLRENRDRPFCLWASFPDPHAPFNCPEPWSRMHEPEEVDLPPHRALDLDRRPCWHRRGIEFSAKLTAKLPGYTRLAPQSDERLRYLIANYYGMISLVDHNVGRMLIALDELQLAERTVVIFTSDHGEWLGDHGLLMKGPMPYEGLLRVGLVLRGPGIPHDRVIDEPVSTLDLHDTILGYAGVEAERPTHSRDLRLLIAGNGEMRDFAYSEWDAFRSLFHVADFRLRTVRTRTHKLTLELDSGAGELYDLVNDPHELDNLFSDAGYIKLRKQLEDMVHARPKDVLSPPLAPSGWS